MERNFKLIAGEAYINRNGRKYLCVAVKEPNCYTMRRIGDDWTLDAHNITRYEDGTIEWDFSSGGYFANQYEVWKDSEAGQTYLVKRFDTEAEADQWMNDHERYYPGWHLRIVEA